MEKGGRNEQVFYLLLGYWIIRHLPLCYAQTGNMAVHGSWKLISIESVDAGGKVIGANEWMGKKPTGLLMYDATVGYMSIQLIRDRRPAYTLSLEDRADAYKTYYAYFGNYEVKETEGKEGKEGAIVYHLQGSLMPEEVGAEYWRMFKISGNRIMLIAQLSASQSIRLTFERVEKGK